MRIAFITDGITSPAPESGLARYSLSLLHALAAINPDIVTVDWQKKAFLENCRSQELILPNHWAAGKTAFWQLNLPRRLAQSTLACDVILNPGSYPGLGSKGYPYVQVVLDIMQVLFPSNYHRFRGWYLKNVLPHAVRRAAQVIAISECTRRDITANFPVGPDKVSVVYPGLPHEHQAPAAEQEIARVRQLFKVTAPFVLFVGTFQPQKNIPRLLRAFDAMKKTTGVPHQLVLAGQRGWKDGEIFKTLSRMKHKQDVIVTGFVTQPTLTTLYHAAEALVQVSLYEGFGFPVIEAMSAGCPVLISSHGSLPEIAGSAAVQANPYQEKEIAAQLYQLLSDQTLRAQLRKAGRERAAQFSWETCARETLAVLTRACQQSSEI